MRYLIMSDERNFDFIPDKKLISDEYYINKLSLALQNSYGISEHLKIFSKTLSNIYDWYVNSFWKEYENKEIFYLYVRAFMFSILGSPLVQQNIGETYSPFSDVDLVEFICSIPLKYRRNYYIYDQWVIQKYPEMLKWKHNGIYTIGSRSRVIKLCGREIALKDLAKRICWKISKELHIYDFYRLREGQSMNPEDSWFEKNESLKQFANDYYKENIYRLNNYPNIKDIARKYNS